MIEGASAIFPPKLIDDYGWLEPDFRLTIKWPGHAVYESLQVFSDDSMNRVDNFLAPIIRRCVWKRAVDMLNPDKWPTAAIDLGFIRDQLKVNSLLLDVHKRLSRLPFVEQGLCIKRDVADIHLDPTEPAFSLWATNGAQSIEYSSLAVSPIHLGFSLRQIHSDLLAELVPMSHQGWRERYDYDLREAPRKSWELQIETQPAESL